MAFALALQSLNDLPEGHGQTIFTATTAIIVLSVSSQFLLNANLSFVDVIRKICCFVQKIQTFCFFSAHVMT